MGECVNKWPIFPRISASIALRAPNRRFDQRIPIEVEEFVGLGWHRLSLQFPWAHQKQCRFAVEEALSRVEGLSLRHKPISELSGGETKRVLLAYCLVRPRRLLILDEALFIVLLSLVVAVSIKAVGVLLVSAFVVIPACTARLLSRGFSHYVLFSASFAVFCALLGIILSALFDLPSGPSIVATQFGVFLSAIAVRRA